MLIRLGIPTSFRRISAAAADMGAPILASANAFRRPEGGFRAVDPKIFRGCDVALDSAGFVAMARYGRYLWTVDQYLDLVARGGWSWWAAMDFCCEPPVAGDAAEVARRVRATADKLAECLEAAGARGIGGCLPVLQGWRPRDYLDCHGMMRGLDLPDLLGVGSVCRRHLGGPDGLMAVVAALDHHLPPRHKLHLFGVKGSAIGELAGHPRIASVDSMAWDAAARRDRGTGPSDLEDRIASMRRWYQANRAMLEKPQLRLAV